MLQCAAMPVINYSEIVPNRRSPPAILVRESAIASRSVRSHALARARLVVAMVAGGIIAPVASKLGMTKTWADTTLADESSA